MLNWSIGDLGGALIVAPLILAWGKPDRREWQGTRAAEYSILLLAAIAVTYAIFGDWVALYSAPLVFLLLPFLLWCSFRFGPGGVSLLNAVMIGMVIWGTTHGRGPFASESPTDSLILIQLFTSVLIVTALLVMIVNRDRQRMTERLREDAERLEAKVIERTLHLKQANRQLVAEIADRQRAEAALQQLNDTLEQRVAENLAKNREKSEFSMAKAVEDAIRLAEATFKHGEVEIRHG